MAVNTCALMDTMATTSADVAVASFSVKTANPVRVSFVCLFSSLSLTLFPP